MSTPDTLADRYIAACLAGDKQIGLRARLAQELDDRDAVELARLTAPGALLSAARWYANQGIAVFPLQPRGKTPACRHGFKDATCDLNQIEAWWAIDAAYNIGAPTGLMFDVVDVDGQDGVVSLMMPDAKWRDGLIGMVNTPRPGGTHLYYRPTGLGNAAGIHPSVDYRGVGGYVVMPPSVGANGRMYSWLHPLVLG